MIYCVGLFRPSVSSRLSARPTATTSPQGRRSGSCASTTSSSSSGRRSLSSDCCSYSATASIRQSGERPTFPLAPDVGLLEAIIPSFAFHLGAALRRGLLKGYRTTEEALPTVRGRVRFDDQIRFRYGLIPPVEVRYDDFTEDITENRLLKAALHQLRIIPVRSSPLRETVRELESGFATVTAVEYPRQQVPEVAFTRLNEHYRPAIGLARLILRDSSIELRQGNSHGTAVMFDMAKVFEDFVYVALREHLQLTPKVFPQGAKGQALNLATGVRLRPDISWWDGARCSAIGDIKYKTTDDAINHPDLYQLLAYLVAYKPSSWSAHLRRRRGRTHQSRGCTAGT